jgi:site-specific recombinase XerD
MFPRLTQEIVMSPLRQQMEADMVVRGLALRTRETYVEWVARFARFHGKRPDRLGEGEVERYLLHLLEERKLAHSSVNIACSALQFFYRVTLKRREAQFDLPRPKVPQRLPQILSREEVARLFEKTTNLKHRAFLMTTYGGGLRLLEACQLKVADVDSKRMTLRVEQGKGAKDRYTLLSPRLLAGCAATDRAAPGLWLFPSPRCRSPAAAAASACSTPPGPRHHQLGGIHALRHAFATHLLEAGTDVHTIQRLWARQLEHHRALLHLAQSDLSGAASPLDLLEWSDTRRP